jgi:hypothetical protein
MTQAVIDIAGAQAQVMMDGGHLWLLIDSAWVLGHSAEQTNAVLTDFVDLSDDLTSILRVAACASLGAREYWPEEYYRTKHLARDGQGAVAELAKEVLDRVTMYELREERERSESRTHKRAPIHGFVYVMRSGPHYKIGASKNPGQRLTQLQTQPPFEIEGVMGFETDDMLDLEHAIHEHFADKRVNGEWFLLDDADVALLPWVADECRKKLAI